MKNEVVGVLIYWVVENSEHLLKKRVNLPAFFVVGIYVLYTTKKLCENSPNRERMHRRDVHLCKLKYADWATSLGTRVLYARHMIRLIQFLQKEHHSLENHSHNAQLVYLVVDMKINKMVSLDKTTKIILSICFSGFFIGKAWERRVKKPLNNRWKKELVVFRGKGLGKKEKKTTKKDNTIN